MINTAEEMIRVVLDEIGLQSSLAEIRNRVVQSLNEIRKKSATERILREMAKVWESFARGEQTYEACLKKIELWAAFIWQANDDSGYLYEGCTLNPDHIWHEWCAWIYVANPEGYSVGYPSLAYCCQIRKKVQRERGEEYDCRTYEGQPDRNMILV